MTTRQLAADFSHRLWRIWSTRSRHSGSLVGLWAVTPTPGSSPGFLRHQRQAVASPSCTTTGPENQHLFLWGSETRWLIRLIP